MKIKRKTKLTLGITLGATAILGGAALSVAQFLLPQNGTSSSSLINLKTRNNAATTTSPKIRFLQSTDGTSETEVRAGSSWKERDAFVAPESIYIVTPKGPDFYEANQIGTGSLNAASQKVQDFVRSFEFFGAQENPDVKNFDSKIDDYLASFVVQRTLSGLPGTQLSQNEIDMVTRTLESVVNKAKTSAAFFNDPENVFKIFKSINQFSTDKDNALQIFSPKYAYSVDNVFEDFLNNRKPTAASADVTSQYIGGANKKDISYEIANIDISKIAQDAPLDFTISDNALKTGNSNGREFHLYIDNREDKLKNKVDELIKDGVANPTTFNHDVISTLLNDQFIYIRDARKTITPEVNGPDETYANSEFFEKFTFAYEYKDNAPGSLHIYANPAKDTALAGPNIDSTHALTFKATNDRTKAAAEIGFLNVNIDPVFNENLYATGGPLDGGKLEPKYFKPLAVDLGTKQPLSPHAVDEESLINIQAKTTAQGSSSGKHFLWLYIRKGSSYTFNLTYEGDPDKFDQTKTIKFDYTTGQLIVEPDSDLKITKAAQASGVSGAALTYASSAFTTGAKNPEEFIKISIQTDGQKIQIAENKPVSLVDGFEDVYFETPGLPKHANSSTSLSAPKTITAKVSAVAGEHWKEYLGAVYSSWEGLTYDADHKHLELPEADLDTAYGKQRSYDFDYAFFHVNERNRLQGPDSKKSYLVKEPSLNQPDASNRLILNHDKKTFAPIFDNADPSHPKINYLSATGKNTLNLLNTYNNLVLEWEKNRLNKALTDANNKVDKYIIKDVSQVDGFVERFLLDPVPTAGTIAKERAKLLAKLLYEPQNLQPDEIKKIDDFLVDVVAHFKGITADEIKRKINGKLNIDATTGLEVWDADAIEGSQWIVRILEATLVECIQDLFKNIEEQFAAEQNAILGDVLKAFLDDNKGPFKTLNPHSLKFLDNANLPSNYQNKGLITIGDTQIVISVDTGLAQIDSILRFIEDNDLTDHYISTDQHENFERLIKESHFTKNEIFTDPANKKVLGEDISVLDQIFRGFLESDYKISLPELAEDIQGGNIKQDAAIEKLHDLIDQVVNKVGNGAEDQYVYESLGNKTSSSYLKNLILGKNLGLVINNYVDSHPELSEDQKRRLNNANTYDPAVATSTAVNVGYYNVQYFVRGLTEANRIPETLKDLEKKDFSRNIEIDVPHSKNLFNFLSSPDILVRYGILASGGFLAIIGLMALGISFRKQSKFASSGKAMLVYRFSFLAVTVLGIALAVIGFIIPIL